MSWETAQAPLIFFEGEDEAELINQFVYWRATHSDKYNIFQVCDHLFSGLKDGSMRANQAALKWQADLTITKRIDDLRNNGPEAKSLTKAEWQTKMLALIDNEMLTPQEKAARIKGLESYASTEGWIIKAVESKTKDETRRFPRVVIAQANAA